jgi:hypothetical protein
VLPGATGEREHLSGVPVWLHQRLRVVEQQHLWPDYLGRPADRSLLLQWAGFEQPAVGDLAAM